MKIKIDSRFLSIYPVNADEEGTFADMTEVQGYNRSLNRSGWVLDLNHLIREEVRFNKFKEGGFEVRRYRDTLVFSLVPLDENAHEILNYLRQKLSHKFNLGKFTLRRWILKFLGWTVGEDGVPMSFQQGSEKFLLDLRSLKSKI